MNRRAVEPSSRPRKTTEPVAVYLRRLPGVLRQNPGFRRYLIGQAFVIFGGMGVALYVVNTRMRFGVSDVFAVSLTLAALVSQSVGVPVLGWLGDKLGHTWLSRLSALLCAAGAVLVLVSRSEVWLYPAFVLTTWADSGSRISRYVVAMEFGVRQRLPTFVALSTTVLAAPVLLAPVVGGWVAQLAGYPVAFAGGAVLSSSAGW